MQAIEKIELYKSPYISIYFIKEYNLIESAFTSEEISENNFKKELLSFLEICRKYVPKQTIWDLRDFSFAITPIIQDWIDENINKVEVELGVKKEAFLMSKNFISQLSIEQSMDEEYGKKLQAKYFSEREDAINWLLQEE